MKKHPRNLALRSETLRTLVNMDLTRAIGGFDTGAKACEGLAIVDTGAKACRTGVAVVATMICRGAQ
jgi:hypothetical protein